MGELTIYFFTHVFIWVLGFLLVIHVDLIDSNRSLAVFFVNPFSFFLVFFAFEQILYYFREIIKFLYSNFSLSFPLKVFYYLNHYKNITSP